MTLIGAACAGLLLWLASQVSADSLGGYWAFVGLAAAAGLTMALSQLLGGWTKWGWPQVSGSVFLLGFLPGLVAGGLVLLAASCALTRSSRTSARTSAGPAGSPARPATPRPTSR
jgi:MFS family permease